MSFSRDSGLARSCGKRKGRHMRNIFNLAILRIARRRKQSLLLFAVIMLSFASAIASVSVVGSIQSTNAEYRLNTYGEWYLAIPNGTEEDGAWLEEQEWSETIGEGRAVAVIAGKRGEIGLGTVDEAMVEVGRLRVDSGRLPLHENEIAVEADALSDLGYDYTLGQEITVSVQIDCNGVTEAVERTYTLCGIVHEYSSLWTLHYNRNNVRLSSAIITASAAESIISEAETRLSETVEETRAFLLELAEKSPEELPQDELGKQLAELDSYKVRQPVPQYFITVSEENRESAYPKLNRYLSSAHFNDGGDAVANVNALAYPEGGGVESYDEFYMRIIALLTFVSVICIGVIQLPSDSHSFSILRSVGMSRWQLGLMQFLEMAILSAAAIVTGVPLGAGITWLALRLTVYSGSVAIQVSIPWEILLFMAELWLAAIFISRLIIFVFTLRVPMVGRLQMNTAKSRFARRLRSGFIILLLCIYSASAVFTTNESVGPSYLMDYSAKCPSYAIYSSRESSPNNPNVTYPVSIKQSEVELFGNIPGVSRAYGFVEEHVGLSFEGFDEQGVYLLCLHEEDWADIFDFGENREAFENGEFVFILETNGNTLPMPNGEAEIYIHNYADEIRNKEVIDKELLFSQKVKTRVYTLPARMKNRTMAAIVQQYTVLCSETFMSRLIKKIPENKRLGHFGAGDEFGYSRIFVDADISAGDLSSDSMVAKLCKELGMFLSNRRQEYAARSQECAQALIMLYFSGGCICIIALMIIFSTVALEAKHEKRGYIIRRCIGMSHCQIRRSVFVRSALRCIGACAAGVLLCAVIKTAQGVNIVGGAVSVVNKSGFGSALQEMLTEIASGAGGESVHAFFVHVILAVFGWCVRIPYNSVKSFDFISRLGSMADNLQINGLLPLVLLICIIVPLILILWAKRDLAKDVNEK